MMIFLTNLCFTLLCCGLEHLSQTKTLATTTVTLFMQRNVPLHRSNPVFKSDPELMARVNNFRSWVAGADNMAEKYSGPPTPIDFASVKSSVCDTVLVEALEKLYSSSTPPAEVYEWTEEDKAARQAAIEDAEKEEEFNQEMIEDTKKEIEFLKANMTTRDTTSDDVAGVYPEIAEEIYDELEKRQWFKDTPGK